MSTATASYPYKVTKTNDDYVFTYKKAKYGLKTLCFLIGPSLILSCILVYNKVADDVMHQTMTEKMSMFLFYLPIYTFAIVGGIVLVLNLFRQSGTFTIGKEGIIVGGTTYPYSDIQSMYIKAPNGMISSNLTFNTTGFNQSNLLPGQTQRFGEVVVAGGSVSGLIGGGAKAAELSGKAFGNSLQKNNYKICFVFGQQQITLASQIKQITAQQLIKQINSIA